MRISSDVQLIDTMNQSAEADKASSRAQKGSGSDYGTSASTTDNDSEEDDSNQTSETQDTDDTYVPPSFLQRIYSFNKRSDDKNGDGMAPGPSNHNKLKLKSISNGIPIKSGRVSKLPRTNKRQLAKLAPPRDSAGRLTSDAINIILKLQGKIQKYKQAFLMTEKRHKQIKHQRKLKIRQSGSSYTGDIADGKMNGFGKLTLETITEYITGTWNMNRLITLESCQVMFGCYDQTVSIIKRQHDYLLFSHDNPSVARVRLNSMKELDFTASYLDLKKNFFNQLQVLEIWKGGSEVVMRALNALEKQLKIAIRTDPENIVFANTVIQLYWCLAKIDNDMDILRSMDFSGNVKLAAAEFLNCYSRYEGSLFFKYDQSIQVRISLKKVIAKIYLEGIALHEQMLRNKCPKKPATLFQSIMKLHPSKRLYVSTEDLNTLAQLVTSPRFGNVYPLEHLAKQFVDGICGYKMFTQPSKVVRVMSVCMNFARTCH